MAITSTLIKIIVIKMPAERWCKNAEDSDDYQEEISANIFNSFYI